MAKAPIVSLDEIKENFILCEICEEEYDAKIRIPMMLPCLHNFCLVCLKQIWGKDETGLLCPKCRQRWKVEGPLADAFPVDFISMRIVNFVEVKKNPRDVSCKDCPEEGKADHYCKDCQLCLCTNCRRYHQRFFKDHQTLTIEQLIENPIEWCQKREMCLTHENCKLDFYCNSRQCQKAICVSCTIVNHRKEDGHDVQDLHQVWQEKKKQTGNLFLQLKQTIEILQEDIRDHDEKMALAEEEEIATIKKVKSTFDKVIAAARQREEEVIQSCKVISEKRKSVIKSHISMVDTDIQKKKDFLQYVNQVVTISSPSELLTVADSLQEKFTRNGTHVSVPPQELNILFDSSGLDALLKKIEAFGSFEEIRKTFYQRNPVIETFDAVVGKESTILRIFLTRQENLPVTFIREALAVEIEDPEHHVTTHSFLGLYRDQPQLQVKFMPQQEGKHTIILKLYGQDVFQHGFSSLVKSGGNSNKCLHLLHTSEDGQTTSFTAVECPAIEFCPDSLNNKKCSVTPDGGLVREASPGTYLVSSFRLKTYPETLGRVPLVGTGFRFWMIKVNIDVWNNNIYLLETGVAHRDIVDTELASGDSKRSWNVVVWRCNKHNMYCFTDKYKESNQTQHVSVFHKSKNSKFEFSVGFLLDLDKRTMHVIDVEKKSTVLVVNDVDVSKPLYPVFGIFSSPDTINIIAGPKIPADRELFDFLTTVIDNAIHSHLVM